jgi:hypothetical protein
LRAVYGQGFFHLCLKGVIWYTIVFDYEDPDLEYYELLRRGGRELKEELEAVKDNMQKFLDEERMFINGKRVRAIVRDVWIEVRGIPQRPSLVFSVVIPYTPSSRERLLYEDYYEEEVADYDYTVHWIYPECVKVVDYTMSGKVNLSPGHLRVSVRKGTRISDYESILFDISTCGGG